MSKDDKEMKQFEHDLKVISITTLVVVFIAIFVMGDLNNRLKRLEAFHTETTQLEDSPVWTK